MDRYGGVWYLEDKEKGKSAKAKGKGESILALIYESKRKNVEDNDLQKRLFKFAVDVIKMLRNLRNSTDLNPIKYQLTKSSGSSGANYLPCQIALDG